MPLLGGSPRSRVGATAAISGLQGWDATQAYMLSHDEDMIGDFTDDIDTLLVFAGLFSAILTAFIGVSVLTLQQDNTQVSAQVLSLIALQLGAPNETRPFLHSTVSSLPTSASFQAATSSVAINSLWLISLVLSLAAALFGMLAKQWCREYLRWHSAISKARDNVIVRQARFEAWQRWNVPGCIASIPALLEIALILFFIGLALFVFTLHRTIAILVNVVIGMSLAVAFAATIYPAISRLCPFKSPTGFVFARLVDALVRLSNAVFPTEMDLVDSNRSSLENLTNWRERDTVASVTALSRIRRHLVDDDWRPLPGSWTDITMCTIAANETKLLVNALIWLQHVANDSRPIEITRACLHALHGNPHDDLYSSLSAVCQFLGFRGTYREFHDGIMQACYAEPEPECCGGLLYPTRGFFQFKDILASPNHGHALPWADINDRTIVAAAWRLAPEGESRHIAYGSDSIRAIALLLAALRCIPTKDPLPTFASDFPWGASSLALSAWLDEKDLAEWATALNDVFTTLATQFSQAQNPSDVPDILLMIVQLLRWMKYDFRINLSEAPTTIVSVTVTLRPDFSGFSETVPNMAMHDALNVYESTARYEWPMGRDLFTGAVSTCLRAIHPYIHGYCYAIDTMILTRLITASIRAAQISLSRQLRDFGGFRRLDWLQGFSVIFQSAHERTEYVPLMHPDVLPQFLLLLSYLREHVRRRLISTDTPEADFECLWDLIGRPQLPDLPEETPVERPASLASLLRSQSESDTSQGSHGLSKVCRVAGFLEDVEQQCGDGTLALPSATHTVATAAPLCAASLASDGDAQDCTSGRRLIPRDLDTFTGADEYFSRPHPVRVEESRFDPVDPKPDLSSNNSRDISSSALHDTRRLTFPVASRDIASAHELFLEPPAATSHPASTTLAPTPATAWTGPDVCVRGATSAAEAWFISPTTAEANPATISQTGAGEALSSQPDEPARDREAVVHTVSTNSYRPTVARAADAGRDPDTDEESCSDYLDDVITLEREVDGAHTSSDPTRAAATLAGLLAGVQGDSGTGAGIDSNVPSTLRAAVLHATRSDMPDLRDPETVPTLNSPPFESSTTTREPGDSTLIFPAAYDLSNLPRAPT